MIHQSPCLRDFELIAADRLLTRHPQPFQQHLRVVFHRGEHLGVRVAAHHVVDLVLPTGCQTDMHGIGGAEQVVEIAHHLLVGPPQEHADQIGLLGAQWMEFQQRFAAAIGDEAVEAAVGIACEIGEVAEFGGAFPQPMQGHQREELLDRPGVRGGAENREIGVIGAG